MKLIALKAFSPNGLRYLKKNETFEISASSARLLIKTGRAKVAEQEQENPELSRRHYKRRDMNAEK